MIKKKKKDVVFSYKNGQFSGEFGKVLKNEKKNDVFKLFFKKLKL